MNKKILLAVLIFAFVLGLTYFIRINQGSYVNEGMSSQNLESINSGVSPGDIIRGVGLADLNIHNSREDCWISFQGKVYDITSFLLKHPGGVDKILPYCGTADEFQKAFTEQHGTFQIQTLIEFGVFIGDFDAKGDLNV